MPGAEAERQDLTTALRLVKELLSSVDQDVHELEKGARLQEIYSRLDPRAQAPVPGKGPFGREELLRRKLIHDGCLLWKTATGRFKGQRSAWQAGRERAVGRREGQAPPAQGLSTHLTPRGDQRGNTGSASGESLDPEAPCGHTAASGHYSLTPSVLTTSFGEGGRATPGLRDKLCPRGSTCWSPSCQVHRRDRDFGGCPGKAGQAGGRRREPRGRVGWQGTAPRLSCSPAGQTFRA